MLLCEACTSGRFGKNCMQQCDCSGSQCNPETGECVCEAGRLGPNCSRECPRGRSGVGCQQICQCRHNSGCDPVSGECICQPGWFGPTCTQGTIRVVYIVEHTPRAIKTCHLFSIITLAFLGRFLYFLHQASKQAS